MFNVNTNKITSEINGLKLETLSFIIPEFIQNLLPNLIVLIACFRIGEVAIQIS